MTMVAGAAQLTVPFTLLDARFLSVTPQALGESSFGTVAVPKRNPRRRLATCARRAEWVEFRGMLIEKRAIRIS